MTHRRTSSILIAAALIVSLVHAAGCEEDVAESEKKSKPVVAVETVEPRPMIDALTVRATIEPWQTVDLSAEMPGRLVACAKDEGDVVARGKPLFGIDKTSYQARLMQAKATERYQVANCERCRKLFDKKAISEDTYDRSRADRDVAVAAVASAQAELDKTAVVSPIDGVLDVKAAEVGEYLSPGDPLGTIVDTSRVKVIVPVPEKDIVHVRAGDTMTLTVDALGPESRTGKVIFIKQVGDPDTLTFPVHLEVANPGGRIRPMMIARVSLVRDDLPAAITAPLFAVIRRADGYHVFVEVEGVARRRDVTLGFPEGDRWLVLSGLEVGDRLIVRGHRNLIDGDEVGVLGQVEAATE
jgi:membrane fusion protein, multidrug efflux system